MHLNSAAGHGCHQKKLHPFSSAFRIRIDATESISSFRSFVNPKARGMHEFPEPLSYRICRDLYLLQLPFFSATPLAEIWELPQFIEETNIIQTSFKNCTRQTIRNSSLGKEKGDRPPTAKGGRKLLLRGHSSKVAKLSQNSPLAAKGGKVENQNKTASTQRRADSASGLRSHFCLQSAGSRAAAARRAGQAAPSRAPLHTCLGRGPSLGVYLLQRSPTPRHPWCGAPLNPTTSRPASAALPAAGEPESAMLLHPGGCTGFLGAA